MATFLTDDQKALLHNSAIDVIEELDLNENSESVKTVSFVHYSEEKKQEYQIQIIVTRHEADFMDVFGVEITN